MDRCASADLPSCRGRAKDAFGLSQFYAGSSNSRIDDGRLNLGAAARAAAAPNCDRHQSARHRRQAPRTSTTAGFPLPATSTSCCARNGAGQLSAKPELGNLSDILSTRLRRLREELGETLQQTADAVGCSKPHLWELETGRSANPRLQLLRALAGHFGVRVAYLIGEDSRRGAIR